MHIWRCGRGVIYPWIVSEMSPPNNTGEFPGTKPNSPIPNQHIYTQRCNLDLNYTCTFKSARLGDVTAFDRPADQPTYPSDVHQPQGFNSADIGEPEPLKRNDSY